MLPVPAIISSIVVDSSCSAEFVAASIGCKQLLQAENMVQFFGFSCPKPYRFYTDSTACLHIATNPSKLGNVRHLQIRYHLVRCCVSLGDIEMVYCITEEMIADLFTKLVMATQDTRLSVRFYSLIPDLHSYAVSNTFSSFPWIFGRMYAFLIHVTRRFDGEWQNINSYLADACIYTVL